MNSSSLNMSAENWDNFCIPALKEDLESKHLPQLVYKYRSVESALRVLENGCLYFAKPEAFNDPFEVKYILQSSYPDSLDKRIEWECFKKVVDSFGILCLGWKVDNLLMWSHYGDKHRGVALGFDITADFEFFAGSVAVDYNDCYPIYSTPGEAFRCLARKSRQWIHEREIRVLKRGFSGLRKINRPALKSVHFGCRASEADIARIKRACIDNGWNPRFFQFEKSPSSFALIETEIG